MDPMRPAPDTLLIHGGRTTWEGNVGFNDGHVSFETKPTPEGVTYNKQGAVGSGPTQGGSKPDNLFVNETDEGTTTANTGDTGSTHSQGKNAYLRVIANRTTAPSTSGSAAQGFTVVTSRAESDAVGNKEIWRD